MTRHTASKISLHDDFARIDFQNVNCTLIPLYVAFLVLLVLCFTFCVTFLIGVKDISKDVHCGLNYNRFCFQSDLNKLFYSLVYSFMYL